MKKGANLRRATTNGVTLSMVLFSLIATSVAAAAEGQNPSVDMGGLADVVRLARGGDPVAYGRLWAYSNRCGIEAEVAGAAAGRVASSAMRTGQAKALEDFFSKAQPGLRQGNSVSKGAINCAATRESLLDLAGATRGPSQTRTENDPHAAVTARNSCAFKPEDPAAIVMTAYLNEKNGIDGRAPSREMNIRGARLADSFIAPQYMDRYRVVPGTADLDTKGSRPEKLLCVKARGGAQFGITAITNRENGWTWVMEYQLIDEKGRLFILPTRPPAAAVDTPFKKGNDPTTSIAPMSVVDGYPDTKE